MKPTEFSTRWAIVLLLGICAITLFWMLGTRPLITFDESRQAVSAFEMAHGGNPFVTTFEGQPDMWNTKPPLFIWATALSLKLFGYSEWALRLPSALAALILVFSVFSFVKKYSNTTAALFCALVLATSCGFIGEHAARTADFDSTVSLFIFLYFVSFYNYLQTGSSKYIWLTALYFTLAFYTKSVAACFALPSLFVFAIWQKKLVQILKTPTWYVAIIASIVTIAAYYIIREQYNPGYIKAAWTNDAAQRYTSTLENNKGPWYHYFTLLGDWRRYAIYFILLLPLSIIALRYKAIKQPFTLASILAIISIFTIIASADTKLAHYDVPLYPFLAIVVGMGLYGVYHYISVKQKPTMAYIAFLPIAAMLVYCVVYINTKTHQADTNTVLYGSILKELKNKPAYPVYKTNVSGYHPGFYYYQMAYKEQGITLINNDSNFTCFVGDTLLTCDAAQIQFIEERFTYTSITSSAYCKALIINGFKQ